MREKQKPSVCVNQLPERERRLREVGAQHGMSRAERTTDRSRGCRSQGKTRTKRCEQRAESTRRVSPLRGGVWGYPNPADFLRSGFGQCPIKTTNFLSEAERKLSAVALAKADNDRYASRPSAGRHFTPPSARHRPRPGCRRAGCRDRVARAGRGTRENYRVSRSPPLVCRP